MQELKISTQQSTQELTGKTVTIFFEPYFITLAGNWYWDFASDAVFCSNLMLALPQEFEGTKGIIHPDDVGQVKEQLASGKIHHLEFRLITSYGDVRTIVGESVTIQEEVPFHSTSGSQLNELIKLAAERKEAEHLLLFKEVHEKADRFTNTGIWYYKHSTNETWYSAEVFRIFDLAPFSLNAHLNTFLSFIHSEDRNVVEEYMNRSYKEKTPLHIEYRIQTATAEKYVQHISQWMFSSKGESILSGMFKDITEKKSREKTSEDFEQKNLFLKQQLLFDEDSNAIGHWALNLVTRKFSFSSKYYRLFGLKAKTVIEINSIYDQIHPDDRDAYKAAMKKMLLQHTTPEIDFRIYRGDGKLRYMSQKAKLVTEENELVMIGTVQDLTIETLLKKKIKELTDAEAVRIFSQSHAEEMAGVAGWVWNTTDNSIKWSENFYNLVGLKSSAKEITHKFFLSLVHPGDQKNFRDYMNLLLQQKQESSFDFRLVQWGRTKYMKASFRLMRHEEDELFIAVFRDVSKEHQLEEKLKERVQLAEALSENILDRVLITDVHHTIKVWNNACEKTYQKTKDEVIGKNFFDVFPKLKTEEEISLFNRVLKGERIFIKANPAITTRGFFDLHLLPVWDNEQTEINGIIHIMHDVTYETELRRNLNERLRFIESLVDSSVDPLIALDRNMNYVAWNKKAEQYYGISKPQVIGKNILEIFPSLSNHWGYAQLRNVLKGEIVHIPASTDEETGEYTETYLIPVKDGSGEVTTILWIVHDLSTEYRLQKEQHAADEKIKEQAHYLQRITETTPDLISIMELETRKFTFLNVETFRAHGFDPEQIERNNVKDKYQLTHPDDHQALAGYFQRLASASDNDIISTEYRAKNRDEEWKWFFVRGKVFQRDKSGKVTHVLNVIENITARKQAEERMNETSQLLQTIMDTSIIGICLHEAVYNERGDVVDFRMRIVNKQLEKLTGRTDLKDKLYSAEFPGIRQTGLFEKMVEAMTTGKPTTLEYDYPHDGFQKTFISTFATLGNYLVATNLDITDRKRAEEKLKESRHWLEQTAKASPDSITVYDVIHMQPLYLNNCLAEWTGICNDDLMQMGVEGRLKLIHAEDRQKLLQSNDKTILAGDGDLVTVEYRIINTDGKIVWLRNRSKPFTRDASGKVTHILSVLQNVTEEVELRGQLRENTQFAEAILDASVDRITVFDRDYKFVGWNKRCEQIHRKTKEEVIGKTIFEIFPGVENYPEFMNSQWLSLKGEFIHVPMVKDGYTGDYLELFYVPLQNANGETYAVVNIMHDVSDYVIATEQLNTLNKKLENKNIELEQKNDEITGFAFVASHDMKEPLRKIHTFSDWLLEQEMGQLSAKGKSLVEKIGASVHRMEILIDDILVLTKIHSDTHREEDVDLNKIMEQILDDMTDQIKETGSIINTGKLPAIKANPNQVFYLFKNLISNAIKFQKPGSVPQLTITSEMVNGSNVKVNEPREEYLKLSFTDNGFGFDQRYAKKIFQVFQRLHGKHEFEGTGMGLAICKKIMENHKGIITVESEQGKGSVFNCFFPLH